MKHPVIIPIIITTLGTSFLVAQEPVDVKAPKEEIEKILQEQHYPIKVTFRVIDESGNSVNGADMDVGIDSLLHSDGYNNYQGKTTADGLFAVESRGRGCTEVLVSKEGYYPSRPEVNWDGELNPGGPEMLKNGGFRPWNPTLDVVLKKIGKPIPLLVRIIDGGGKSYGIAPLHGVPLGWDLIEADWVAPHGAGKKSDLILKLDGRFENSERYFSSAEMHIIFPNSNDGFISIMDVDGKESLLKFPRQAPDGGYNHEELKVLFKQSEISGYERSPEPEPEGYFIRIRTETDSSGKVVSAVYGKITSPIRLTPPGLDRKNVTFSFSSYFNPTPNDRNLEYDQQNNLAPEADKGATYPP